MNDPNIILASQDHLQAQTCGQIAPAVEQPVTSGNSLSEFKKYFSFALFLRVSFVISSIIFADVLSIVVSFGWTPVSLTPRRIITSKVLICKQKVLFWIKGWFKQKVVVVVILQIQLNSFQAEAVAEVEAIPRL